MAFPNEKLSLKQIIMFHESLIGASQWLVQNNPIYIQYNQTHAVIHLSPSSPFPEPLPMARLPTQSICDTSSLNHHSSILTNSQPPSLVVPNNDFPIEYNNPDIEALVFPDIFPGSCGHYEDVKRLLKFRHNTDSYGKYIKLRTLCSNPRFRLHWYWPHWSYLNLEKKCNKNRILNQKNVNHELHPTRADLISRSTYDNQPMINEALTTTLPSSIQTSEAFFRKNQHHVNTMEIGINGTDDIAVAVFNNKVFIGGSILPSAPSDPYFDDVIDKYFCRPKNHIFESMTYPDYFRDYNIKNKPPGPRSKLYSTRDLKGSELATWGVFKFQGEVPEHVSNEIPASFDQTGSQFTDK
ncbi:998_t:CDS:2 [Entrophospora sp. SA101]|nr:998_t:CDS:2 [Entrophospora sp. SA101]